MRVSVAIATYRRAPALPKLVSALERQTIPPDDFEVIFVDDGSPDETRHVLETLTRRTSLNLRILGDGRNRGPAYARNLAWRAARGGIVAFTDDDCLPTPVWLEEGLKAMGDARRIVVGRTIPDPDQHHLRGPFSRTVAVEMARYFETCNVFYRRGDLESVGGFDERFPHPGGEDTDLGWRVRHLGADPVFAGEAVVFHDVKPSDFTSAVRVALRWTGIPRVVRLHEVEARRLLIARLFWKESHPRVLAALVGIALSVRTRWSLALCVPWIWYRVRIAPLTEGRRRRWLVLPGAFIVDLAEVAAMVRGSVRERTIVL